MKTILYCIRSGLMTLVALVTITLSARSQEVSIPDPGLNAAIREALGIPTDPLTEEDLLNLTELHANSWNISSTEGLEAARNLSVLELQDNRLTSFNLSSNLTQLTYVDLAGNQLTDVSLPAGLSNLATLSFLANGLSSFTLPPGMTNLGALHLSFNQLTNVTLPSDLKNLNVLTILSNQLTHLDLPEGLTNLSILALQHNQLTNLTLPPDMLDLTALQLGGNPFVSLVLSEPLAATNLAGTVASLREDGILVFTYPLAVQLVQSRTTPGAFQFGVTGPPGVYTVLHSTDFAVWGPLGLATNEIGATSFTDTTADLASRRFYRAVRQSPPTNMVFIPPTTFIMGSPTNEQDRSVNEGPQTTVILTRGFWIGKFEVTQGEYLSVMNTNPSVFPGDLRRPVSSVRWLDATNYCAKLTERELAAGRIPPGSHFRLPTEAEWECAARAGTTTRFSYGDDPQYAQATNYMWEAFSAGLTVHPVGQKLPNPRGLYDVHGNVWEWCQDWYDTLPGGVQVDPTGPSAPAVFDSKVMRGGAYDYSNSSCRSASRLFFPATPFHTDTDLGFRVVLVFGP